MKKLLSASILALTFATSAFAQVEQIIEGNLSAVGGVNKIVSNFSKYVNFDVDNTILVAATQSPVPAEDGFRAGNVYYIRLHQVEHKNSRNQTIQKASADIILNDFSGSLRIAHIDVQANAEPHFGVSQ